MINKNAEEIYGDIIHLPHHEPTTRQRMPAATRAASFSPFAALTGYDESVKEAARLTSRRIDLDDDTKEMLNNKLKIALEKADEQPGISITYFKADKYKSGGEYVTITAVIKKIDEYKRRIILSDKSFIPVDDIYNIDGDIYDGLY